MRSCTRFVAGVAAGAGMGVMLFAVVAGGCVEPEQALESGGYWVDEGSDVSVSEPIEFTDDPDAYAGISGEMTIEELKQVPPGDPVWMGFSTPYPVDGDCTPDQFHTNIPEVVDEFPAEIEAVVTVHPRFFENLNFCGSRERNQGAYVIQDETGGVYVLKDSRVADVDVGDHIRMTVHGLVHQFGRDMIVAFEPEEVIESDVPIYYEEIDRPFDEDLDQFEVRRIEGVVVMEGDNQNFGEMRVQSLEDPDVEWSVGLDREITNRRVGPVEGTIVQLTGPVIDSFGLEMMIANLGQIEVLGHVDDSDDETQD